MKKKNKIIYASYSEEYINNPQFHPKPLSEFKPEWYKKLPAKLPHPQKPFHNLISRIGSVKICPSFADIFNEGYVITAPMDYWFKYNNGVWEWETPLLLHKTKDMDNHYNEQFVNHLPSGHGIKFIFKINLPLEIITPKGVWIRQMEMPFTYNKSWFPITGIQNTDKVHQVNIQIALTAKKGEILIKQGTPLAVHVPFKKETYDTKFVNLNKNYKLKQKLAGKDLAIGGKFFGKYYR